MRDNPAAFTELEQDIISTAGRCMGLFRRMADENRAAGGAPVDGDLAEVAAAIHVLQREAMSNAAYRANPETVRPFGAACPPAPEAPR